MATASEIKFIKKYLRQKLEEQVRAFRSEHCDDSDEQLLAYLRQSAEELGGTVFGGDSIYNYDIIGTKLLQERFGNKWENILIMAGVPKLSPQERTVKKGLYCRECRRLEWCVDKTRESLAQQEQEFLEKYGGTADEELLAYIQQAAERLGHTPASTDVAGRKYIIKRFGSWAEALRQAGLPKAQRKLAKQEVGRFFMDEFRRWETVYAENLSRLVKGEIADDSVIATDKMVKKSQRDAALEEKAQELAKRMLSFKEKLFVMECAKDSDKLLLNYLAGCAEEIGRTPHKCEVIGGDYLSERFGSWAAALQAAGCAGEPGAEPEEAERLIFTREVQIQKYLLAGRETVVWRLYNNPLVGRMQAGNVYHILRWNPAAANSADNQCHQLFREAMEENGCNVSMTQREMEAGAEEVKTIYNNTLTALDLQTRKFEQEYRNADKKELLAYVRQAARQMEGTPKMLDVVGAEFIMQKLHCTWNMVLRELGLKRNGSKKKIYQCKLFKEEFKRQRRLWEQENGNGEAV